MQTLLAVAVLFAAAVVAFAAFQLMKRLENLKSGQESMALFQQQIESLRGQVSQSIAEGHRLQDARLGEISRQVRDSQEAVSGRLQKASEVFGEVQRSLGALGTSTERILEVGKDISSLQEILQAPKLRGSLGELLLGDLLGQILPASHFTMQHRFLSGEVVDAVVKVGERLVPVDAKFPLENFKRLVEAGSEEERRAARRKFLSDVKKHVDAIASKYILPDERTYDFALMYIPAENVYYETVIKDDALGGERSIASHALERRVIPVSPNSLFAYLQVIALGLRGLKVEEQAQIILSALARMQGEFARFADTFEVLGKHIGNAQKAWQDSAARLSKMEDKLSSLKEGGAPASALGGEVPAAVPHLGP